MQSNNADPYEVTIKAVDSMGKPVTVEVHHYHHYVEKPSPQNAGVVDKELKETIVGRRVRIVTDASGTNAAGTVGCYLGANEEGVVGWNYGPDSDSAVWTVCARDVAADGHPLVALQSPHGRHFLRVNAKGEVDARGGGGRWTLFVPSVQGNFLFLRSLANTGKANTQGTSDWYLAMHEGKLTGTGAAFSFPFRVEGPAVKDHSRRGRPATAAEAEARKEAREQRHKEKEARIAKKVLSSGWTVVGDKKPRGSPSPTPGAPAAAAPTPGAPPASPAPPATTSPAVAAATTPNTTTVTSAPPSSTSSSTTAQRKAFPVGFAVTLMPVAFAEMQNRKGTTGWHLGIAPMGFLVPDASAGGWSQMRALSGPEGSVIFESMHTPAFHLAIRADMQLTHKGGKSAFAQWEAIPEGKYWAFRCKGHAKDVFLAVSASGVPYAATELSRDTRFKLNMTSTE